MLPKKECYSLLVHSKIFILSSRHKMHTVLQPQTTCSVLHHWYVQPTTWPLGLGTAAVWHPVQTHLRQKECSGWHYILAQDPGPVPRQWQWQHIYKRWQCCWKHCRRGSCHWIGSHLSWLQNGKFQFRGTVRGAMARHILHLKGESHENKTGPQLHARWQQYTLKNGQTKVCLEPTIVVPRKLTSLIIVEFHNGKGH